jgi:hypothetical protein
MKVIYRKRQTGRTTELLDLAEETGATIVCHSLAEANRLRAQAKYEGRKIKPPISIVTVLDQYRGLQLTGKYLIDNLDLCLSTLFPRATIAAAVLEDAENHSNDPHVIVAEHDGSDEQDTQIVFEQYIDNGRGSLEEVREFQKRIGNGYGKTRIARLVFDEEATR